MKKFICAIICSSFIGLSLATVCKDGSTCPGNNTCCLTGRGVGCCPYPNANCCGSGDHCCPNQFSCDSAGCQRAQLNHNSFLEFLETTDTSMKELTFQAKEEKSTMGEIIKCIEDIKPIGIEMKEALMKLDINDKASIEVVKKAILQLAQEGKMASFECLKKLETLIREI